MASLVVVSRMWLILLSSICLASLKFAVAEDQRYGQEATGQFKYVPSLSAPLSLSPPSSNNPTWNFEVPLVYNKVNNQFEEPQTSSDNCPQVETLQKILALLRRLLNEDETYVLQPDKRIQILKSLKDYLERSGSHVNAEGDHLKLKELINRTDKAISDEKASQQSISNKNVRNHIEANLIFKLDIPNINNVGCKEVLASLIKTIKNAYLQMISYCNESEKCNLNLESNPSDIQHNDKSNTLHSILTLDPIPAQSKETPSIEHLLNIYDAQSSLNDLVNSKNQVPNQNGYLNPRVQPQSDSQNNFNAGVVQNLNKKEKNVDGYKNIYLYKDSPDSNIQHQNKLNFLSFQNRIPTQVQITPANRQPTNIHDTQNPLNYLVPQQNPEDPTPRGTFGYLNHHVLPESYLNSNQFLAANALNAGVLQTKNVMKQEKNLETSSKKYMNSFDSNGNIRNIYAPTSGTQELGGISNPLQVPLPINYNKELNQRLAELNRQFFNDKSASMGIINQNNYNIKDQIQYTGASIPGQGHNYINDLSFANPKELKNFASWNLIPSRLLVNSAFYSNWNMKQNPYLSSINLNRLNNYNTQQADAVQSKFGLNVYAPFVNYPKHDIYGNTLFDSHRFASMPNVVKLNSVPDNEGIVELTYKLKRPQSTYNPYYYVKFRMPYKDFVSKIIDFSKNPEMRSNPIKVHEELLSVSNLADASPDLKSIQPEEVSKLILNNGGTLINAKVLGDDSNADENLKTIQNLNAKLNSYDIFNLVENDKTFNPYLSSTTLNSGIAIFRPEKKPFDDVLLNQNVDSKYKLEVEPQRLLIPTAQHVTKTLPISFVPSKYASQILSNPENNPIFYATSN